MTLRNRSAIVTGAGGFIGSHLTEALVRAGARTRALVHYNSRGTWGHLDRLPRDILDEVEVISGDIRDARQVRHAVQSCEFVFHLAALIGIPYSYVATQSYLQTNIEGTLNVLEACREAGVNRLLHTSTSEVYGTPEYAPIDEAHPLHAQSPYAATKSAADQLALSYHASFDLNVTVVRPFNTYGPRQSARAVIPAIIAQALSSDRIALGTTDTTRDFLYVSDNADGYLAASLAPSANGQIVQLATGIGIDILGLGDLIGRIMGRKLEIDTEGSRQRPEKSEVRQLIGSNNQAATLLNWQPRVNLEVGLQKTVEWIAAHPDDYRPGRYAI